MMVQSAFGLEYIHKKEVLHRDIGGLMQVKEEH